MEGLVTFSIPADREELLSQDGDGCFSVREDIDIACMSPVNLVTTIEGKSHVAMPAVVSLPACPSPRPCVPSGELTDSGST